jgi:hypothetical protein
MASASIVKRALDYQKSAFDASYNTMVIIQGQAEKMASDIWEKSYLPKESATAFATSMAEFKKRRDDLKKMVDENFNQLSNMLNL